MKNFNSTPSQFVTSLNAISGNSFGACCIVFFLSFSMLQTVHARGSETAFITTPAPDTVASGQSQAVVTAEFIGWLAAAEAHSGCDGALSYDCWPIVPPANGGTTTVTFTYKTACGETLKATSSFTIKTRKTSSTTDVCVAPADLGSQQMATAER